MKGLILGILITSFCVSSFAGGVTAPECHFSKFVKSLGNEPDLHSPALSSLGVYAKVAEYTCTHSSTGTFSENRYVLFFAPDEVPPNISSYSIAYSIVRSNRLGEGEEQRLAIVKIDRTQVFTENGVNGLEINSIFSISFSDIKGIKFIIASSDLNGESLISSYLGRIGSYEIKLNTSL